MGWPAGVVSANITNSGSAVGDYVFGNAVSAVTITAANGSGAVASGSTSSDSALTLTFTASGTTSDFTAADVTVSGATLSNFTGSGTSYTATLSATSASVTVDVGANKFTSNSLNNVASTQFTWTTSTDLIAPTVSSAVLAASGTTLTLTASETLGASTPAASAFTVSAGGSAISVSSVAVLGTSVTLSLAQAATVGQSISIAYTAPGTNDLQDAAGNLMVGFAGQSVTNNAAPTVTITAANGSGAVASGSTSSDSALTLTFTASGTTSDFTAADVTVSGATLSNFTGSGTSYTATLSATSASVTVDVGANKFTSNSLNNVASTQFTWTTSTDLIAPTVSSAVLAASGTTLTLTASETLGASTPAASAFTVSAGGSAISVSSVAVLGTSVTLSLAQAATVGQSISIAYTAPGTNDLQDAAGNLMVGFAGQSVTNSSTISGQLPSPITKADVVLSVQAQQKITSRASSFAMASVNNRLDWIRINPNITQRSFQGVKLSFANPLLNAVASQNYQNTSFGMEDVFAVGKQLSTGVTEDALAKINRCDRGCTG